MERKKILKQGNLEDNLPIYMTPRDWEDSYKTGPPHWASYYGPSRLARKFLKWVGPRAKVLEIGVGNGRDCVYFAKEGALVFGIDIARGAIKLAKENAIKSGATGIKFSDGNAEELKFKDNFFDGVYSLSVLHATDLEKSIREISRVLRVGGKAIIYLYEMTIKAGKKYWFYKENEMRKIFEKNGFDIVDSWDNWETGHKNEKTRILVFKFKKES